MGWLEKLNIHYILQYLYIAISIYCNIHILHFIHNAIHQHRSKHNKYSYTIAVYTGCNINLY